MEKPLDLQFMKKTVEAMSQETWNWLKRGLLKKRNSWKANGYIRLSTENKQNREQN